MRMGCRDPPFQASHPHTQPRQHSSASMLQRSVSPSKFKPEEMTNLIVLRLRLHSLGAHDVTRPCCTYLSLQIDMDILLRTSIEVISRTGKHFDKAGLYIP